MAVMPVLAVAGVLWVTRRVERRRAASVARQIGLTDAIHRELGAAAAPVVRLSWRGRWTVSMAVPLEREATVGALVRLVHQAFSALDRADAPRFRIVLTPRPRPARRMALPAPDRAAARLSRAGAGPA
jgi:hypothetical protein